MIACKHRTGLIAILLLFSCNSVLCTPPLLTYLELLQETPQFKHPRALSNEKSIPLHFVYVNPKLEVKESVQNDQIERLSKAKLVAQSWMKILPHEKFALYFWTDAEIREFFPDLVSVLSRLTVPSWISDVIRYHIMLRYGGVYLDTDVLAVHDFTSLLSDFNSTFTVCQTPWIEPVSETEITGVTDCESIINAIIAAPPQHAALKCAADKSLAYTMERISDSSFNNAYDVLGTGPACWTSCVKQENNVEVLPSWTFLPCSFFSRGACKAEDYTQLPNVFGVHEWTWSWGR
jgi:hypothetical protein